MYYLYSFDGVRLPSRMAVEPNETGDAPATIVERVGGAVDLAGSALRRSRVRVIQHRGVYIDESGQTAEQQFTALLAKWGRRGQLNRRRKSDAAEQWTYARLLNVSSRIDIEHWHANAIEVTTTFLLHGLWRESTAQNISWALGGNKTVVESGNPIEDAVLTVTATTDVYLVTVTTDNGTDLFYSGSISAGQSLVMHGGDLTVRNNGVGDYANLTYNSGHQVAGFWIIDGTVTFTVTATSGTGTVYLSYYRQHV